jgi:hypothetical protein
VLDEWLGLRPRAVVHRDVKARLEESFHHLETHAACPDPPDGGSGGCVHVVPFEDRKRRNRLQFYAIIQSQIGCRQPFVDSPVGR